MNVRRYRRVDRRADTVEQSRRRDAPQDTRSDRRELVISDAHESPKAAVAKGLGVGNHIVTPGDHSLRNLAMVARASSPGRSSSDGGRPGPLGDARRSRAGDGTQVGQDDGAHRTWEITDFATSFMGRVSFEA